MQKIFILVPSYNSVKTVIKTLESIQESGDALRKVSAVYLADDCSQDETVAAAEQCWKSDVPLITLGGERNLGERGNVNRAISAIGRDADWVLLIHSDDIAKSNWLQMMMSRIETCSDKVGSICSSWDTLLQDDSVISGEDDPGRQVSVIEGTVETLQSTLLRGCWWHISGCAIRISAFEDVGGFDHHLPQTGDWEWLLRCLAKGWSVEYIPRTLILYRQHEASVSSASFQRDVDVIESLAIVRMYTYLLSTLELISFHLQREKSITKRFLRALTKGSPRRSLLACATMVKIWLSLFNCLLRRSKPGII